MRVLFHSIMACGQPEYVLSPNTCFSLKKRLIHIVFGKDLVQWIYAGHVQEAELISETLSVSLKISVAFFSSCQNQELELLYARVKRKRDWKYVKLECSVLVANPGEEFIAKVRIGCQITLQQVWGKYVNQVTSKL